MFASVQFSFPVGFITSDALSHTILLFKSYNGNRLSVHAHVFLKTQFYVYGKKTSYFLFNKIFLLGTITFVLTSESPRSCLCSSFEFNSIGKRSPSVVVTL